MIASVREYDFKAIEGHIEKMERMTYEDRDSYELVRTMKAIVPEYISNSSEYEILDEEEQVTSSK